MRVRLESFCLAAVLVAAVLLVGPALPALAQTSSLEAQLQSVYDEIEALKASGKEIPAGLYERYFEIESQLYPEEVDWSRDGSLDQEPGEADSCPGIQLPFPAVGDSVIVAGETYLMNDRCTNCRGDGARDVVYSINVPAWTRLIIKTCLHPGGFDTYLCVYKNSCCNRDSLVIANDNSSICRPYSFKSYINHCFVDSGRYYIVVDGYNVAANGHYRLAIVRLADVTCGPTPEFDCPEFFADHEEPAEGSESVCGQSNVVEDPCPANYCGIIEPAGDVDVYSFTLNECKVVTLRVFANDTYGHSGYFKGLDSKLRLFSGPACDHPLFENDDVGGQIEGQPWEDDSQIITTCLRPGTYYAEVTSAAADTGDYEFTISCVDCPPIQPYEPIDVVCEGFRCCASWPSSPDPLYYVWRYAGLQWILVGTTYETEFCETLEPGRPPPQYQVFTSPCGYPQIPSR
ncbi:hypothetical protein KKH27_11180 [bacterium]|nr:hypothetical protein [bacterium]MBU1984049.1 hypothetical protein [bacterium]